MLTALPDLPSVPLLLMFPNERVSTAAAFGMLRERRGSDDPAGQPLGSGAALAFASRNILDHSSQLTNDFEDVVFERHPHFSGLRDALLRSGAAWAAMSGSGSTMVGAFSEEGDRDAALASFSGLAVPSRTLSRAESLVFGF